MLAILLFRCEFPRNFITYRHSLFSTEFYSWSQEASARTHCEKWTISWWMPYSWKGPQCIGLRVQHQLCALQSRSYLSPQRLSRELYYLWHPTLTGCNKPSYISLQRHDASRRCKPRRQSHRFPISLCVCSRHLPCECGVCRPRNGQLPASSYGVFVGSMVHPDRYGPDWMEVQKTWPWKVSSCIHSWCFWLRRSKWHSQGLPCNPCIPQRPLSRWWSWVISLCTWLLWLGRVLLQ